MHNTTTLNRQLSSHNLQHISWLMFYFPYHIYHKQSSVVQKNRWMCMNIAVHHCSNKRLLKMFMHTSTTPVLVNPHMSVEVLQCDLWISESKPWKNIWNRLNIAVKSTQKCKSQATNLNMALDERRSFSVSGISRKKGIVCSRTCSAAQSGTACKVLQQNHQKRISFLVA